MPFKSNYKQERSDRTRAKAQKKQEKLQRREEESAKRKQHGKAVSPPKRRSTTTGIEKDLAAMGRQKQKVQSGFVLFDVFYEDGTRTSNRKVPASELGGVDGDAPARGFVEKQDRMIGEMSGIPRGRIKTILRSRKASS